MPRCVEPLVRRDDAVGDLVAMLIAELCKFGEGSAPGLVLKGALRPEVRRRWNYLLHRVHGVEEAVVGAREGSVVGFIDLALGPGSFRFGLTITAFEGIGFENLEEHEQLVAEVLEGRETDLDDAALYINLMRRQRLFGPKAGRQGKLEATARRLRRFAGDGVQVSAEIFGIHAGVEPCQQLLALDDESAGLFGAGHQLEELEGGVRAEAEEAFQVGAGVERARGVLHLAVHIGETRSPCDLARHEARGARRGLSGRAGQSCDGLRDGGINRRSRIYRFGRLRGKGGD
jgi:hypothetical protein